MKAVRRNGTKPTGKAEPAVLPKGPQPGGTERPAKRPPTVVETKTANTASKPKTAAEAKTALKVGAVPLPMPSSVLPPATQRRGAAQAIPAVSKPPKMVTPTAPRSIPKAATETKAEGPLAAEAPVARPIPAVPAAVPVLAPKNGPAASLSWPGQWEFSSFAPAQAVFAQGSEAAQRFQGAASSAAAHWIDLNSRLWSFAAAQREIGLSAVGSLMAARSISDAIEVQARSIGQAVDAVTTQWEEVALSTQRLLGLTGAAPGQNPGPK